MKDVDAVLAALQDNLDQANTVTQESTGLAEAAKEFRIAVQYLREQYMLKKDVYLQESGNTDPPTVNVYPPEFQPTVNVSLPPMNVTNEIPVPSVTVNNDVPVPDVTVHNSVGVPSVNVTNEVKTPTVQVDNKFELPKNKSARLTVNATGMARSAE